MKSTEVEFLEDRIGLLESWLENAVEDVDCDDNRELVQKREEYQALMDEVILLQKKLRKTSKLISKEEDKKVLHKLRRKEFQYSNEIEEIRNYTEMDEFFETTEETSLMVHQLLGEPLETLIERPDMEGSCATLNFSMSDFMPTIAEQPKRCDKSSYDELLRPIEEDHGGSFSHSELATDDNDIHMNKSNISISSISSLFTISFADSNTNNYDESTLKGKLKKVNRLLSAHDKEVDNSVASIGEPYQLNLVEVKKLRKKREQYIQALQNKSYNNGSLLNGSRNTAEDFDNSFRSNNSSASVFTISTANSDTNNYDESTLRKKLKKVNKLLTEHENELNNEESLNQVTPKEVKKLRRKHEQYTQALSNKIGNGSLLGSLNDTEDEDEDDNNIYESNHSFVNNSLENEESTNVTNFVDEEYEKRILEEDEDENDDEKNSNQHEHHYHGSTVSDKRSHSKFNDDDIINIQQSRPHPHTLHDRKILKKKLKKLKKIILSTDDPDKLKTYKKKKNEYKMELEILNQQENNNETLQQGDSIDDDEEKNHAVPSEINEEDTAILLPGHIQEQELLYNDENEDEERIVLLKKKIRKAGKFIVKTKIEDDPKKLRKMEKKREEYQTELDELLMKNRK